ncbi:MAG: pyridoxamine 5'-phosphate oxidase family protein [Curvibacter sp.]|nr:pyridoxamine 5'-phosphate oxidase family protein [Curvibacter sp.]
MNARTDATPSGTPGGDAFFNDPFHDGEKAAQARVDPLMRQRLARTGAQVVRDHLPEQHRLFFNQLPMVVTGTLDAHGQPWASALVGEPGFMHSPDPQHLDIRAHTLPGHPAGRVGTPGQAVGLLGLEWSTRRRNRLNGLVLASDADGFSLRVLQSFGNCPKYITTRQPGRLPYTREVAVTDTEGLDTAAIALIAQADTFFIATAHPDVARHPAEIPRSHGVDVSHRGGPRGFVRIEDANHLCVPDFAGNFYFNTLGNLLLEPRAGLLFIDFAGASLLYLAARVRIQWTGSELAAFAGAQRLLHLELLRVVRVDGGWPLQFAPGDGSPFSQALGPWRDFSPI